MRLNVRPNGSSSNNPFPAMTRDRSSRHTVNAKGRIKMFKTLALMGAAACLVAPAIANAHSVTQTHFLETAKPYAPYEFLIGDWYSKLASQGVVIHQQFKWGPDKSYITYASYLAMPGKPEQLHFEGMMVWDGKSKGLDFLFALQPGSGAQEKGTVTAQGDGTIVREIAMTSSDADLDHFRQTFRKAPGGKVLTSMMEKTANGWKLDPPGEIVMERTPSSADSTSAKP
jgi:hypothetical protein